MRIFSLFRRPQPQPSPSSQPSQPARDAVTEALENAIANRGYALWQDCAGLGVPRSTIFYNLAVLTKPNGPFRKDGEKIYVNPNHVTKSVTAPSLCVHGSRPCLCPQSILDSWTMFGL